MKDVKDRLETTRLILRPYQDHDANDCKEFLLDQKTTLYDGNYIVTDKQIPQILGYFKTGDDRYMIELKQEHKVIGVIHIMDTDEPNVLSIGYLIHPSYQKQGYGYEAVSKAIEYTFYYDSIKAMVAEAYSFNIPSLSLLNKLGFKEFNRTPFTHTMQECESIELIKMNPNECFDIVDKNGNPTGEIVSRKYAHDHGIRHRTAHCWLLRQRNHQLEILVQKRVDTKDSFPGAYDISSAGHIPQSISYEDSAIREFKEELGLTITKDQLQYIGFRSIDYTHTFHNQPFHDNEVTKVYMVFVDDPVFHLQEEEVSEVRWFEFNELYQHVVHNTINHCIMIEELDFIKKALNIGE